MTDMLLNRRLFSLKINSLVDTLRSIEDVDNFLQESTQYKATGDEIVIYGDFHLKEFLVGREVVGFDSAFSDHEEVILQDYDPVECEIIELDFSSFYLNPKIIKKYFFGQNKFRALIKNYKSARFYFF